MSEPTTRRDQEAVPGAVVRGPGEGQVLPGPEGLTLKLTAEDTGGSIGFLEGSSAPGFGAPRHVHHTADELFYILGGEFLFLVGEQLVRAGPGSLVFIPRGTVHAPKVVGNEAGRVLVAFVPGGPEQSFEEFARLHASGGPRDPELAQTIARKYDSEFVGPPL